MTNLKISHFKCFKFADEKNCIYTSIILCIYIKINSPEYVFEVGIHSTQNNWKTLKIIKGKHFFKENNDNNIWNIKIDLCANDWGIYNIKSLYHEWPTNELEFAIYAKNLTTNNEENIYWNNNNGKNFKINLHDLEDDEGRAKINNELKIKIFRKSRTI